MGRKKSINRRYETIKKRIGIVVIIILLFTSSSVYGFTDIKEGAWYYNDVQTLKSQGIIGGYADGSFRPQNNLTNAEALKLILAVLEIPESPATSSHWASGVMEAASAKKLINLSSFEPNRPINREEVAQILASGLSIRDGLILDFSCEPSKIFQDKNTVYTSALYKNGLIGGVAKADGIYFKPDSNISRAEMSAILNRTILLRAKLGARTPDLAKVEAVEPGKASIIKPLNKIGPHQLASSPTSVSDYEDILLYMGQQSKFKHSLTYNGISFDQIVKESSAAADEAFKKIPDLYPEYFGLIPTLNINFRGSGKSNTGELNLSSEYFTSAELLTMQNTFKKESLRALERLIETGQLTSEMTEYEKAKVIFEWVVFNTEYDKALSPEGFGGYGQIVNGKASCQGYTATSNYMLRLMGIEAHGIAGRAGGDDHIWTIAVLDGKSYHIDATWGDPVINGNSANNSNINYAYFGASEEQMRKTHTW